eukprot:TRINITY_DN18715_c0_g1_i1.p1 TRINITY_DN18715_c0_g1~~TRINITY_DN18715_c0_g1_i1.p1  ORF type:complete len:257 (-),score=17.13 TRINITY_DN18715_c0_g1_i1:188-958(-)
MAAHHHHGVHTPCANRAHAHMHEHGGMYQAQNRERASDGTGYMKDLLASTYTKDFPQRHLPRPEIVHPQDALVQPSVMLRGHSTQQEDFPKWPPGQGPLEVDKRTTVPMPFDSTSEYKDHFQHHRMPPRHVADDRHGPPPSPPLKISSLYRDSYGQQPDRGYQNVIPAQNYKFAQYRAFDTTHSTDFQDKGGRRRPEIAHPQDSFEQPDFRTFETETRHNFKGVAGGPACDMFEPNPPIIPQPFVEENLHRRQERY